MNIKYQFLRINNLKFLTLKISKSLQMLTINLVLLLFVQTSAVYGQWFIWSLSCSLDIDCHDQTINVPAQVNFQVTFTNVLTFVEGRGWAHTEATCPNGASVQNNAEIDNAFLFATYDHYSYEMNRFNKILTTIDTGTFMAVGFGSLIYTPAVTLYFPELCSPPIGSGPTKECDPFCNTVLTGQFQGDENGAANSAAENAISSCCWASPIVIDVDGDGIQLTGAADGVMFDFNGDGIPHRISWTRAGEDEAWLVLDRNSNGRIDSSREMFGNMTEQAAADEPNGFLALAEFDKAENGGNADNKINSSDRIFESLRLWRDANHNRVSEENELFGLGELNLVEMELKYRRSKRTDEHGNEFRYRAKVRDTREANISKWAWDVFLVLDDE